MSLICKFESKIFKIALFVSTLELLNIWYAFLANDREFYTLVNLYNVYKNYNFPQNILDVIINRKVSVVGRLCCSRTISNLSFGEWLDLWKNGWIYDGNPVIFAFSCLSGGYIEYWDLVERTLKRAKPKEKFIYTPEKTPLLKGAHLGLRILFCLFRKIYYKNYLCWVIRYFLLM